MARGDEEAPVGEERPHEAGHGPTNPHLRHGEELDIAVAMGGTEREVLSPPALGVVDEGTFLLRLARPLPLELEQQLGFGEAFGGRQQGPQL